MQKVRQEQGVQVSSAADKAYNLLLDLILNRELRPGERTSVNLLSARLGLGRTPMKEAITRLETEGVLSVAGRSGTTVNTLGAEQTTQLFALRRTLEDFAAGEAVKHVTSGQLNRLRRLLTEMRNTSLGPGSLEAAAGFIRANVEFHALIVAAAENPFLDRLYTQLQTQVQIVTYLIHRGYDPAAAERRQREHEEIVESLSVRDPKRLKVALTKHAATTEAAIIKTLSKTDQRGQGAIQGRSSASAV